MIKSYPSGDHSALLAALDLPSNAKILDIGGGHAPFTYAQVVVDIDFQCGSHRDGQSVVSRDDQKQFIQADICALPFPDNSFDFVVCLHVLEHVQDPGLACRELMRVAKGGFIETPRKWSEYYAGHPTHRWLVDDYRGQLIFEPIDFLIPPFNHFALPALWQSPELQQSAGITHVAIPCVQLKWHDRFEYTVNGTLPAQWAEQKFQAKKHYLFAKHLMEWLTISDTVLFHAARAEELEPTNITYKEQHTRCLLLAGETAKASKRGASASLIASMLWIRTLLKLGQKIQKFCTNRLKTKNSAFTE